MLMNRTSKDENKLPAVTKQDNGKIESAKSKALVPYNEQEVRNQKKGFIGNLKQKVSPSRAQLRQLLLENMEALPEHEARLLNSVFDLIALTAQEVMMPMSEITPMSAQAPPSEVVNFCKGFNYRYIPIYGERVDQLVGVVDAMDVLTTEQLGDDLSPFVKDMLYVPPLKSVMDLLGELRQIEIPTAVVVNEYGSCIGIVELVDILEKVVGSIAANRRRKAPNIEALRKSSWRIDARTLLVDVNIALNIQLPTDRVDTLGGFILMLLGRLPQKGEKLEYKDVEFNIEKVFKYGISQIQVVKAAQKAKR